MVRTDILRRNSFCVNDITHNLILSACTHPQMLQLPEEVSIRRRSESSEWRKWRHCVWSESRLHVAVDKPSDSFFSPLSFFVFCYFSALFTLEYQPDWLESIVHQDATVFKFLIKIGFNDYFTDDF